MYLLSKCHEDIREILSSIQDKQITASHTDLFIDILRTFKELVETLEETDVNGVRNILYKLLYRLWFVLYCIAPHPYVFVFYVTVLYPVLGIGHRAAHTCPLAMHAPLCYLQERVAPFDATCAART